MRTVTVCLVVLSVSVYLADAGFRHPEKAHTDDNVMGYNERIKRSMGALSSITWRSIFHLLGTTFHTYNWQTKTRWYMKTGGYQEALDDFGKLNVQHVKKKENGSLSGSMELWGEMPVELYNNGNVWYLSIGRDVEGVKGVIKYSNLL